MNNPKAKPEVLVARLGTQADEPEARALWVQNNPLEQDRWSAPDPDCGQNRLVLRHPSGKLVASLLLGVAWSDESLTRQLGFPAAMDKRDVIVLTTSHACGLPEARYLDVLRYQALHFAQFARLGPEGTSFSRHVGVHSTLSKDLTLVDREQLVYMGYEIRNANSPSNTLIMISLPSEAFQEAYLTRNKPFVKNRLPAFTYEGREPFQHVQMRLRPASRWGQSRR